MTTVSALLSDSRQALVDAPTLADFWPRCRALAESVSSPYHLAVRGGALADRLGWAFVAGYQAAGLSLFGHQPTSGLFSLCATEAGGAHPAAIETRLTTHADGAVTLAGDKRWASVATADATTTSTLYVLATEGTDTQGRKLLRVAKLRADTPGVSVTPQPATPFVPEVPHASIHLDGARADLLPGDGWARWVRPFRTVEDLHVQAAALAYLFCTGARAGWPSDIQTQLLHLIVSGEHLAQHDVSSPGLHIALAGWLSAAKSLSTELEPHWSLCPTDTAERWQRDRRLLAIAGKARAKRLSIALKRLATDQQ